ncbi:chemerin-like receptor 1 [Carettochelys insculpta]|uniref:chemerin-like receptor 1 n=1 Tax=Carettochelys insculpta TaxID=44489 RepID=UPI003EBFD25A
MEFLPIFFLVLRGLAFLAGVSLNGCVLFFTGCRLELTVNALWSLNRAVADFIFIIFLPLRFTFIVDLAWTRRLSSTITSLHMSSSAFLLTALSIDHCLLVAHPVWAQQLRTPSLVFWVVVGTWVLSLGFSLQYCDLWESLLSPASLGVNFQVQERWAKTGVVIQFLVGFLIPLSLALIPTIYIVLAAKLKRNRLIQSTQPLKISLGLILTFFLCWLPYHVLYFLWISATTPQPLLELGSNFACFLTYANSCLNPIFYLTMEEEFLSYQQRARSPQTTDNLGPELAE